VLSLVAKFALQAEDYEACLRVCEMLMEECGRGGRSEEQRSFAVRSCLDLSKNEAYLDFEARSRLASFCVNFCADHELEEVLAHRIDLTEKVPEPVDNPSLDETALNLKLPELANATVSAAEQALADSTRALVSSRAASALSTAASAASTHAASALSTAASAASNAPAAVIPSAAVGISRSLATAVAAGTNVATERGTKAISSLFGTLSGFGFASGTTEEEPLEPDSRSNEDEVREDAVTDEESEKEEAEERENPMLGKGSTAEETANEEESVRVHPFYESALRAYRLRQTRLVVTQPFDSFSSGRGTLSKQEVVLLNRHFQGILSTKLEGTEVAWEVLEPALLKIVREDTALGVSLLMGELGCRLDQEVQVVIQKKVEKINEENGSDKGDSDEGWDDAELDIEVEADQEEEDETMETASVNLVDNCLEKLLESDRIAAGLLAMLTQALPKVKSVQMTGKQLVLLARPEGTDSVLNRLIKATKVESNDIAETETEEVD